MNDRQRHASLEAVHHACAAGDFDAGAAILYRYVFRGPAAAIVRERGEVEAALAALEGFFPFRDVSLEPRVEARAARRWLLHETAACLHLVGRLREAAEVGARAATAASSMGDDHSAALTLQNLAETHLATGALSAGEDAAAQSHLLARRTEQAEDELVACTLLGTVLDRRGRPQLASPMFDRALELAGRDTPYPFLYSLSGIRHADHLDGLGQRRAALTVTKANADFCRDQRWIADLALTQSQLARWEDADLDVRLGIAATSVLMARTSGNHQVLCEVLIHCASLLLDSGDQPSAYAALTEARTLATSTGFAALEAAARTQLARARAAEPGSAQAEIDIAQRLCDRLGLVQQAVDVARVRDQVLEVGRVAGLSADSAGEGSSGAAGVGC